VLRNSTIEAWEAAGRPATDRPGDGEVLAKGMFGSMVRYASITPGPEASGDIEALSLWAGQSVGRVGKVQPAGEIVSEIAQEARDVLRGLAATLA
jgi:nitronate monooxygenase